MAVAIAGIICQELVADYRETYDIQSGPNCTKSYLCPWANRFTVAHGFLGLSSTVSIGGLITLSLPLPYPELASESSYALASMYARTVEIQGVGSPVQGGGNIAFTSAIVRVTFGPFPWSFSGVDYMQLDPTRPYVWAEQHLAYSSEVITVPGRKVFFGSSGGTKRLDQDWGFTSPKIDMTITCKSMPYLPAPAVLYAIQNPISSVTYLGCAAGHLLFNGAQDEPDHASDGTPIRDVSFSFSFRPIAPWDYVYNGDLPGWDQVVDSTGAPIIQRSDLSGIIPAAYIA
jgi:hypothetical protein